MIVNMYIDHLMATPPESAEEVWNATSVHAKLFSDAARRIGLSNTEYQEFRNALLDGKAIYVKLPRRVDAMSGSRRGSVYAVRNAVMTTTTMGWRVALADGTTVYVPQVCGNISMLRPAHVARVAPSRHVPVVAYTKHVPRAPFHPAIAVVAKEQPVAMVPPVTEEAPVVVPEAAPAVAQVVPVASAGGGGFFFLVPAVIGGALGLTHHDNTNSGVVPPPCSNGSNSTGVCSR